MMGMIRCLICCIIISLTLFLFPTTAAAASHPSFPFLLSLTSQCPLSLHPTKSLQYVNGDYLERALATKGKNSYTAVLFYASWCPFSQAAHVNFKALSYMYPHIEHLAVEQSSAMPSLFSRYGIHSLPTILMVNQNSRKRFHGSAELDPLIEFYQKTTGSEPVHYVILDQSESSVSSQKTIMQSWIGASMEEIFAREPYLILSVLFIIIRFLIYVAPRILYALRPIWVSYRPRINLEIFGETRQILGHILHIIDLKRIWSKLRLCKTRNFHRGARNAQVWASLASVSLGKTSTSS
ncbi:OLC1v1038268C1 [Oldenlandia corymbosa var. corymbosa]|uniref:OLC1v1038268C1 n=1 Tax=Oldenlandia corymbosa var. corymbosa TaxID=529605 RepID=A0AAV1D2H5_OLDCO|nr:OLC1v1038268C1 [Oldenlandia corymbosa var. corymbosa]